MATAPPPPCRGAGLWRASEAQELFKQSVAPTFPWGAETPSGSGVAAERGGEGRRCTDDSPPTLPAGPEGASEDAGGDVSTAAVRRPGRGRGPGVAPMGKQEGPGTVPPAPFTLDPSN